MYINLSVIGKYLPRNKLRCVICAHTHAYTNTQYLYDMWWSACKLAKAWPAVDCNGLIVAMWQLLLLLLPMHLIVYFYFHYFYTHFSTRLCFIYILFYFIIISFVFVALLIRPSNFVLRWWWVLSFRGGLISAFKHLIGIIFATFISLLVNYVCVCDSTPNQLGFFIWGKLMII